MKKILSVLAIVALLFVGCSDEQTQDQQIQVDMSDFYLFTDANSNDQGKSASTVANDRNCNTMQVLNRQLNENPGLFQRMYNAELHTRRFINSKKPSGVGNGNGGGGGDTGGGTDPIDDGLGQIQIPVYIYVIYANSTQNISDAQVTSQIDVLNADFNDLDYGGALYADRGANVGITFLDPIIDRRANSTTSWGTNNAVKNAYPAQPGYLTMWVANIGGGILGYAQFPGGDPGTDGIVVSPQYFGNTGTATAPFDGGRTTTHEVGHWMNLRHIWGDGRCRQDDFVSDTPSSDRPNYGCPSSAFHCKSEDMKENYMDYTDDVCMELFSEGQKARMRAVFAPGGPRDTYTAL